MLCSSIWFEKLFFNLLSSDWLVGYFCTSTVEKVCHAIFQVTSCTFQSGILSTVNPKGDGVTEPCTPYSIGYPVDKIKEETYNENTQHKLTHLLQVLVGSLNWLSISTQPDISTITNMLTKYSSNASKGHIDQAKHVIKYLKGIKEKGNLFSSKNRTKN
jgi:hypothetical protein